MDEKLRTLLQWRLASLQIFWQCWPGLPDGLFSNKKFGQILDGLDGKMLIYFMTVWNILCTFGMS
jgi:hypothetical protein